MKRTVLSLFCFVTIICASTHGIAADQMECRLGNMVKIVSVGEDAGEVEKNCGEATDRKWVLDEDYGVVYRWMYNFGPGRIIHFLKFQKGKLVKIELGNLGY